MARRGDAAPRLAIAAACVAVATTLGTLWLTEPELAARGDFLYDLSVARNLRAGRGFTTRLLPLGAAGMLRDRGRLRDREWPSVHKFAYSQVRIALATAILGDRPAAWRLSSLLPYLALLGLVGAIARRLAGLEVALAAGAAAGLLWFGKPTAYALTGLTITTDVLLFLVTVVLLERVVRAAPVRVPRAEAAALGAALAALTLHRYSFAPWAVVAFARLAATGRPGAAPIVWMLAGASAVAGPMVAVWWRTWGGPVPPYLGALLLVEHTPRVPTDLWYTFEWPSPAAIFGADPGLLLAKAKDGVALFMREVRSAIPWAGVLLPLAAVGAWRAPLVTRGAVAAFALVNWSLHLVTNAGTTYQLYLLPLLWLAAVHGAGEAGRALERGSGSRVRRLGAAGWRVEVVRLPALPWGRVFPAALVTVAAVGGGWRSIEHSGGPGWAGRRDECLHAPDRYCDAAGKRAALRAAAGPGAVVLGGDRPWDIALDPDLRVLPLPASPAAVGRLTAGGLDPRAILIPADLAFHGTGEPPAGWLEWHLMRERGSCPALPEWSVAARLPDGAAVFRRGPSAPADPAGAAAWAEGLTTRSVKFGTSRAAVLQRSGFGAAAWDGGGGIWTPVERAGARMRLYLPAGRPWRLRWRASATRDGVEWTVAAGDRPLGTRRFPALDVWEWVTMTLPASALSASGWQEVRFSFRGKADRAGHALRLDRLEAVPEGP